MSVPTSTQDVPVRSTYAEDDRGDGMVAFAGVLMLVLGTLNTNEGIAAIGNAHFFVNNTDYVFGSLNSWGWIALIVGVTQLLVGVGIFARNQFSRWLGIFALAVNAMVQLLMIPRTRSGRCRCSRSTSSPSTRSARTAA